MRQIACRVQALERRLVRSGERKLAIVMAVGKPPEQAEQEIAELSTWLPAKQPIIVIDR